MLQEALQEGGRITTAAARAVEELVVGHRALLRPLLKRLPPLPPGVDALAKARSPQNHVVEGCDRGFCVRACQGELPLHDSPGKCNGAV